MTLRNSLGQRIDAGSRVVLVTQGQGWANMNVGTVEKFSKKGLPQIRYMAYEGRYAGTTSSGTISPPIVKYGRLFVITEEQYLDIEQTQKIKAEFDAQFNLGYSPYHKADTFGQAHSYHPKFEEYKSGLNAALNAAGKENYYD